MYILFKLQSAISQVIFGVEKEMLLLRTEWSQFETLILDIFYRCFITAVIITTNNNII